MSNYIISFKDTATPEQIQEFQNEVTSGGGELKHTFKLNPGFSAKIQPQTLQAFKEKASLSDSIIASIEEDGVVTTQ
ncbi:hypothetical protein BT96DRAFT_912075 [Gymnopus androsaceus JB14]|uniref:Inhibitor I9 domain-containing protein n=1 Tax=Gymnopus androsaceus JB14 TaxID=1447944 RepID=A0A6A4IM71_9AGAR|nr:hypothetical protein BT96DRAFT_912075 [Gymnopus androsaceus JB14]